MTVVPWRGYDRVFEWMYEGPPPPPAPPGPPGLPLVMWAGLDISPGHLDGDFTAVVELVEGWYGSPPLDGNDTDRALADGAAWGPKVLGPRSVAITGAAVGPRELLDRFRDGLAARACARVPAPLAIGDPVTGQVLTAEVRAGTDTMRHEFIGGARGFRWQVTVTAADPLLYEEGWQQAVLTDQPGEESGRRYPRDPPWAYALPSIPNQARLANGGNADAPVWALYEGPLTESRLADDAGAAILLGPLLAGEQILVSTAALTAEAAGGQPRASYIRPGSQPMLVPPGGTSWHLYAQGSGSVTLAWRAAWV